MDSCGSECTVVNFFYYFITVKILFLPLIPECYPVAKLDIHIHVS